MKKNENTIRLFEREETLTGRHALYLKYLKEDAKVYESYIDAYISAAIVGYLYKRTAPKDNENGATARIQADAFATHRDSCLFAYRLITLLDGNNVDKDERVNRAFRYDSDPEKVEEVKECFQKFQGYVRGGIEWLYEKFTSGCTSREDYIVNSMRVLKDFKDEVEGIDYEAELKRLLRR